MTFIVRLHNANGTERQTYEGRFIRANACSSYPAPETPWVGTRAEAEAKAAYGNARTPGVIYTVERL